MSERRRRYSFYQVGYPAPIIEDREPERARSPTRLRRRRTVIIQTTSIDHRRRERVEQAPSPPRYIIRPRAPTPPPRVYSPLPVEDMPPKKSLAAKPFVPLPEPLVQKKEEVKVTDKSKEKPKDKLKEKSKDRPEVKIYKIGHRHSNSYDTGYGSGVSSPRVEERSPLDYTTAVPKSPKPRSDEEGYETIVASSKVRYVKVGSDRKKDAPPTTERTKVRYVTKNPDSPGTEDEYVPGPSSRPRKDIFAEPRRATRILQEKLVKDPETPATPKRVTFDDTRSDQLEVELRKIRLERQIAEGRAAEAKLKQQEIEELNRRERELKQQQAEEQRRRLETMSPREAELAEQQWREIEATPVINPTSRRPTTLVDQKPPARRNTLMTPYGSTALTTSTPSPSVLATVNPFFAPILEAQRDEDARRARDKKRGTTAIKETGRTERRRPRNDDRYI